MKKSARVFVLLSGVIKRIFCKLWKVVKAILLKLFKNALTTSDKKPENRSSSGSLTHIFDSKLAFIMYLIGQLPRYLRYAVSLAYVIACLIFEIRVMEIILERMNI